MQIRLKQPSSLHRPLVQLRIFSPPFGLGLVVLLVVLLVLVVLLLLVRVLVLVVLVVLVSPSLWVGELGCAQPSGRQL